MGFQMAIKWSRGAASIAAVGTLESSRPRVRVLMNAELGLVGESFLTFVAWKVEL